MCSRCHKGDPAVRFDRRVWCEDCTPKCDQCGKACTVAMLFPKNTGWLCGNHESDGIHAMFNIYELLGKTPEKDLPLYDLWVGAHKLFASRPLGGVNVSEFIAEFTSRMNSVKAGWGQDWP